MQASVTSAHWPTPLDAFATAIFFGLVICVPVIGYIFMVLDFRAYLRSLRRALVTLAYYFPEIPEWARCETPHCLLAFGLQMPCSEDELKSAYRHKVKHLHPDRGGDKRRFLRLQGHFEDALRYLSQQRPVSAADWMPQRASA